MPSSSLGESHSPFGYSGSGNCEASVRLRSRHAGEPDALVRTVAKRFVLGMPAAAQPNLLALEDERFACRSHDLDRAFDTVGPIILHGNDSVLTHDALHLLATVAPEIHGRKPPAPCARRGMSLTVPNSRNSLWRCPLSISGGHGPPVFGLDVPERSGHARAPENRNLRVF